MNYSRRHALSLLLAGASAPGLVTAAPAWAQDDDIAGMLNIFISPAGKPFRAPRGAPYPVVDWFKEADRDGDGKIDHAEFIADAAAFFKVLDINNVGFLGAYEIAIYERRVAPEILGYQYKASARANTGGLFGGQFWLAQMGGMGGGMGGMGGGGGGVPTTIDPAGPSEEPSTPKILHDLDETQQGASPFSLFDEPEPVTAADFDFNGKIRKVNFLKLADMHFTSLDTEGAGYLTLAKLPKTEVQKRLEKRHGRR